MPIRLDSRFIFLYHLFEVPTLTNLSSSQCVLPEEWLKQHPEWQSFFLSIGITEKELENKETTQALVQETASWLAKNGNIDKRAPPPPPPSAVVDEYVPPPPPPPTLMDSTDEIPPPPPTPDEMRQERRPAPPPPTIPVAPVVAASANIPAPPPAPPAATIAPSSSIPAPPPPPPVVSGTIPSAPSAPKAPNVLNVPNALKAPPLAVTRSQLKIPPKGSVPKPQDLSESQVFDLRDILLKQMNMRRVALKEEPEESEDDEENEFED